MKYLLIVKKYICPLLTWVLSKKILNLMEIIKIDLELISLV